MHTPVLPNETIEELRLKKVGVYIDATAGEGGHLIPIAKSGAQVIAIDRDKNQIDSLRSQATSFSNIIWTTGNFAEIEIIAKKNNIKLVDGVLFDLGLSMGQISSSKKGFSYQNKDEKLDMRLSDGEGETASDVLNRSSEEELYDIFAAFSEELNSLGIASSIYRTRLKKKFSTVQDLTDAIDRGVVPGTRVIITNVYARIFQALRIAVNSEFVNLKKGLVGASKILKKGGRLVIITFHSIEDRIVKSFIQADESLKEIKKISGRKYGSHAFERSALLRVAEKI